MLSLIVISILLYIGWRIGGFIFDKPKQNAVPITPEENGKPRFTDDKYNQGETQAEKQLDAMKYALDTFKYETLKELDKKIEEQKIVSD